MFGNLFDFKHRDMKKWFGKWNASHLLHDASIDSSRNVVFCNANKSCFEKMWRLMFHTFNTYIAPNYKTIFITYGYMLDPIPLSAITPSLPYNLVYLLLNLAYLPYK